MRRLLLAVALVAGILSGTSSAQTARTPSLEPYRLTLDAPIATWDEAIPVGNGITGGLLWGEGRTLRLSLDRADLWDLRTPDIYKADDWNYATIQRLVKARDQKELVRRFDAPFEEIPYPTKLPGARLELTLEDGPAVRSFSLDMRRAIASADFGDARADVFFSADEPVTMMRIRGARVTCALIPPASLVKLGYSVARLGHDVDSAWLVQEAALGLVYAVHVASRRVGGDTELAIAVTSNRPATTPTGTTAASRNPDTDPLASAKRLTAGALARGFDAVLQPHVQWWRRFWQRSSVTVPDAKVQQHYNLVQYFYGAASRRGAPPMPLQGVWTADAGSLPPWKGDFHFDLNVQLSYWAYLQAGHFDEGLSYLDFMWDLIPVHRVFARRFFNASGIVVPGVMALDGQPLAGWGQYSLSPVQGAWVAHAFYLHWRYTADRRFLDDRAYPYCALVAEGLLSLMTPDANGKLNLPLSSSPEIHDNSLAAWMTPPSNYDLSLIRWLFGALKEMAADSGRAVDVEKWDAVLARLGTMATDQETGVLKVSPTESLRQSHRHLSHLMAIHPLGLLSTEGGDEERRTVTASLDDLETLGTSQWVGYTFSWAACMEARAGRAEAARRYLDTYVNAFVLRNGFHANGDQTKSGYSTFTYRPFTLEGNFAAAQAVHEMLLESWGGVVRVFPAVATSWLDASFRDLRAEGGFRVTAHRAGGKTVSVRVTATRAGPLRIRDPFNNSGEWTILRRGRRMPVKPFALENAVLLFRPRAADVIIGRSR